VSRQSDHDRTLERLLRAMPEEPDGATAACVDAEQLAAWSDGSLSPAERASIDAHLASCARCLAMLAAFSDTAPEVSVSVHEGSVPLRERGQTPPLGLWRWVVPIGTAAAAVLIWMVLPARPPAPAFAPTAQVARDEAAPPAPVPQRLEERSADQTREKAPGQTPASPPPAALSKAGEPAGRSNEQDQGKRQEKSAQEAVSLVEERAANAGQEALSDRTAATAPAPPPAASAPAASVAGLRRFDAAMVDIPSPDSTHRWRIRAGLVERSTTGGSSWQLATIPTGAIVAGGTSPAPNVCWLIGPGGTVLRTTDGLTFEAVTIAGAGTLTSIRSTDATHATVTAGDGRIYSTSDGGRNWSAN
jgi:hypothetical protein